MGFFKDLKQAKQSIDQLQEMGKQQQEAAGYGRGMGGLVRMGMDGLNEVTATMQQASVDAQHLQANGVAATATLSAISDTGITVNDNPTVDFELMVTIPGQQPFPARHRQTISRLQVGQLVPGATLAVRVDPADHQRLVIT